MRKLIAFLLSTVLLCANTSSLISCVPDIAPPSVDPPTPNGGEDDKDDGIITPGDGIYDRETVAFGELTYVRPDVDAISQGICRAAERISDGKLEFEEMISLIEALEDDYVTVRSMHTLAQINNMKNIDDEYWKAEYSYVSTEYPKFIEALEQLFVACALSEHKSRFEEEYFGSSLDDYVNGGIYNDEVVALMSAESQLENRYSSLSTSNVMIRYRGAYDTPENILSRFLETYGEDSKIYKSAVESCMKLYEERKKELSSEIFTDLLKTRSRIADELGYESYTEYAYRELGHDYSPENMRNFLLDIRDTVYPVLTRLYNVVFNGYFYSTEIPKQSISTTVNSLFEVYKANNAQLADIYSYMLQYMLYDIEKPSQTRFSGSFTTYIESNDSPFLFVTGEGLLTDYVTVIHEFGHFADNYINHGASVSLDLAEISSQALELLTLDMMRDTLPDRSYRLLEYYEMYNALEVLLMQGFYAMFEHLVYEIEYEDISEESINNAVLEASKSIFGVSVYNDVSSVLITHTMLYPHYVQSYCTSLTASLEMYFLEIANDEEGTDIYMDLITRDEGVTRSYTEELIAVGLSSPFEEGYLRSIADSIHFRILGSHFFRDDGGGNVCLLPQRAA